MKLQIPTFSGGDVCLLKHCSKGTFGRRRAGRRRPRSRLSCWEFALYYRGWLRKSARREGGEIMPVGGPRGIFPPGRLAGSFAAQAQGQNQCRRDPFVYWQVFGFTGTLENTHTPKQTKKKKKLMASAHAALFPHHHSCVLVIAHLAFPPPTHAMLAF